jgi:hypothetical protein
MRIRPRDRVYLLRQGPEPRGIIGAGAVVRGSYSDVRWDDPTRRAAYVVVEWTHLSVDPLIPRQGLGQVADVHWDTRSSGIEIPAPARNAVERLWRATSVSVP